MAERWFAFRAYNAETLYGYGTAAEASEYQDYLNRDRAIDHYAVVPVKDPSTINGIEFNIGDELRGINDPLGC